MTHATPAVPDARERLGRLGVWILVPAGMPLAEVRDVARAVEGLGYGAMWCAETPRTREALVQSALLLDATDRLTIATGITSIYSRDAIALHAGMRGLEEAHPGRLVVGIGVSHKPSVQQRGHGYGKPLSAMREYLDAMDGRDAAGQPPRVLAALRPRMLELARDRAAGAHPYLVPVHHTARAREILGADALLAPEMTALVDGEPERARATARVFLEPYLELPNYNRNLAALGYGEDELRPDAPSDRLVDDLVAWGSAADIVARVEAHFAQGADHVCVQVLADDADSTIAQLGAVAEAVTSDERRRGG